MKKGSILTLKISDVGISGDGIAVLDNGKKVYVKNSVVGDVLNVVLTECHKTFYKAEINKILSPSKHRIKPKCNFVDVCGGCQLQQTSYKEQLRLKRKFVETELYKNNLQKIVVLDTIASDNIFRYRNKALIPFSKDNSGKIIAGIYQQNSHQIVDCQDCIIGVKENSEIIKTIISHFEKYQIEPYNEVSLSGVLRHVLIRKAFSNNEIMVSLITNALEFKGEKELAQMLVSKNDNIKSVCINPNLENTNVIFGKNFRVLFGSDFITDCISDIKYKISPLSFFQINHGQIFKLYNQVSLFAQLSGKEIVFDIYCGAGTISLFLAKQAKRVIGIESIPQAVENAKENAKLNNILNAEFFCGKAEEVVPQLFSNQKFKADVIIVDPPRSGCEELVLKTILKVKTKKMIYVSCNPVSLSRDLKFLTSNGFSLKKIQPLDMFPQTTHVETVALLNFGK